jgi:adenylate cyclase
MLETEKAGRMPGTQPSGMHSAYLLTMSNAAYAAWLDVGDQPFPLVGKTLSLGRAKDNNVVFTSSKVSRRHALVHAQGDSQFSLVDLGSSNGTHLNGRRVSHPVSLQHGDLIQIGEQNLVFRLEAPETSEGEIYMTEAQMTERDVKKFTCWFLLLDIKNFVELSSQVPTEELAQMVGAWLGECQRLIENHGGTVSKFLGDGLLVYWNERSCDCRDVAQALNALRSIQARQQPPFRWALHFGAAVFGSAAAPGELSALGQDLNFLFRIERLAAANSFSFVVSESAHAQMGPLLGAQPLGSFSLKGLEGEHAVFGR